MKKEIRWSLSIAIATNMMWPAQLVFGQSLNTENTSYTNGNTTTTVSTSTSGTGLNGETTTNIDSLTNIDQQALEIAKKQKMGQMLGLAGAAFSGAMAAATCSKKPADPSCPMWVLGAMSSLAVAGAMSGANNQSMETYSNVTDGTSGGTDSSATESQTATERQVTEAAAQAGLTPNMRTGTLKFPDGRTVGVADLANNQSMAAAGMSADEISGFNNAFSKAMKEAQKNLKTDATKVGGDGVAGGAGSSLKSADVASSQGSKVNRDPAQIAGLSKNYNGDPIGVASENLFTLINRRYDYKAHQKDILIVPATTTKSQ